MGMSSRVASRRTTSRCRSKGRLNCPTIICTQDLGRTCDQVRCYGACEPLRIQRIVLSQLAIEHLHARTNPLHDKEQFVIQGGCYARHAPSYAHGSHPQSVPRHYSVAASSPDASPTPASGHSMMARTTGAPPETPVWKSWTRIEYRASREDLQHSTLQNQAVIAMRGLVNLSWIMGMIASQIADRCDLAGARISRAPAAEHPAKSGRDRLAGAKHDHGCDRAAGRGSL